MKLVIQALIMSFQQWKNNVREQFITAITKNFKVIIKEKKMTELVFAFFKRRHEWIHKSVLNYSIFMFGGTLTLATVRYLQMWATGYWTYLSLYYCSITFSFLVSVFLTWMKWSEMSGNLQRKASNHLKTIEFIKYVSKKQGLDRNFRWGNNWLFVFLLTLNTSSHFWANDNTYFLIFSLLLDLVTLVAALNRLYLAYWIIKTPIPKHLLLEPSPTFVKICSVKPIEKIILRRYGTTSKAYTFGELFSYNKKIVLAGISYGFLSSVATLNFFVSVDRQVAGLCEVTPISSRLTSTLRHGWYTHDPKLNRKAWELEGWGVNLKDYRDGAKRLRANEVYTLHSEEYLSRHGILPKRELKAEIEVLQIQVKNKDAEIQALREELLRAKNRDKEIQTLREEVSEMNKTQQKFFEITEQLEQAWEDKYPDQRLSKNTNPVEDKELGGEGYY